MLESYVGFANLVSSSAYEANATWPMFRIPNFELHARQVRLLSGSEVIGCSSLVDSSDGDEYLKFVNTNYEASLNEAHITLYGNLDRLAPIGYTPNFTVFTPDGIVPDTVTRQLRAPTWQISPRMLNFAIMIVPDMQLIVTYNVRLYFSFLSGKQRCQLTLASIGMLLLVCPILLK